MTTPLFSQIDKAVIGFYTIMQDKFFVMQNPRQDGGGQCNYFFFAPMTMAMMEVTARIMG